jgi:hypothetical protein
VPLDNLERLENRPLTGLNFYMLVNRENWQLAPLEPGGSPTPTLDAVRKVIQLIARLPEFGSLEPISPVALAWQTSYARDAYAAPATDKGRKLPYEMTVGAFAELACAGYLPRIWITEEPPSRGRSRDRHASRVLHGARSAKAARTEREAGTAGSPGR